MPNSNKQCGAVLVIAPPLHLLPDNAMTTAPYSSAPTLCALKPLDMNTTSVIQLIDQVISHAIDHRASDVHFEPYRDYYRIRLRLDGVLILLAQPPLELCKTVTARLKVLADLDIAKQRVPQDGRFTFTHPHQGEFDLRVSSLPTALGEKMVLRILYAHKTQLDITALGLSSKQQHQLSKQLQRAQGMTVVTGPTGSGKTITLYSILRTLDCDALNILSAEDPIEIQLPGINQVQINTKSGMTFATALRAFLRQDPDVILVGEIRDTETANIAMKAAQTGHLVLSTLHTNSASDALIRLVNMGIPRYQIASAVRTVIAQRLVRRLCEHCKVPATIPTQLKIQLGLSEDATLFESHHCQHCHDGFLGRMGIFEVLPMSARLVDCLLADQSAVAIRAQAQREGVATLYASGLERVERGQTSLAELQRVLGDAE